MVRLADEWLDVIVYLEKCDIVYSFVNNDYIEYYSCIHVIIMLYWLMYVLVSVVDTWS